LEDGQSDDASLLELELFKNLNLLHKNRNLHKYFTMSYGCDTWSLTVWENQGKFILVINQLDAQNVLQ